MVKVQKLKIKNQELQVKSQKQSFKPHFKSAKANLQSLQSLIYSNIDNNPEHYDNFGNIPPIFSDYKNSKFVILPVPYEATTSYGKGTARAPKAIIRASQQVELFDIDLEMQNFILGIHTAQAIKCGNRKSTKQQVLSVIKNRVKKFVQDKKCFILIGGEHTVSIGSIGAVVEMYPDISILQLDAHADLRDSFEGEKYSHACAMRRAIELCSKFEATNSQSLNNKIKLVQIGIRSACLEEFNFINDTPSIMCVTIKKLRGTKIQKLLRDIDRFLAQNVYISIDIDAFDTSEVSAVGTPEPGGLKWNESLDILSYIINKKNIVGIDVVELSPVKSSVAAEYFAAKLIFKLIGFITKYNT